MMPECDQPSLVREIAEMVSRYQPSSLVYVCTQALPALDRLRGEQVDVTRVDDPQALERAPRFELGMVFDFLEHCAHERGVELLGRLRNVHCERIWVAVQTDRGWDLNAMIALGFKRGKCFSAAGEEVCTYVYDIENYNHKREWNTPKYWANPENWGKYWW